jgi:hypothetical protein
LRDFDEKSSWESQGDFGKLAANRYRLVRYVGSPLAGQVVIRKKHQ